LKTFIYSIITTYNLNKSKSKVQWIKTKVSSNRHFRCLLLKVSKTLMSRMKEKKNFIVKIM